MTPPGGRQRLIRCPGPGFGAPFCQDPEWETRVYQRPHCHHLRYGIREHAMASISNGIAAYNPGTFLPITATFFMFFLYVRYLAARLKPTINCYDALQC